MHNNKNLSAAALLISLSACLPENGEDFKSETRKRAGDQATPIISEAPALPQGTEVTVYVPGESVSLTQEIIPAQNNFFYVATSPGNVYQFTLDDENQVKEKKEWFGAVGGNGGTRTYVTESGLVLTRTGGYLYWVDPEKTAAVDPAGAGSGNLNSPENFFKFPSSGETPLAGVSLFLDSDRACIVSYKRDGKRFIGMGYGLGAFVEIPLTEEAPYTPVFDPAKFNAKPINANDATRWGYSCYIDQQNLIYYSNFVRNTVMAISLKTAPDANSTVSNALALASPINKDFVSNNLPTLTLGPRKIANVSSSYALAGRDNKILNGNGFYTMSYENQSEVVWTTNRDMTMRVTPFDCFHKDKDCAGFATYNVGSVVNTYVGPISAMSGGRIIGMTRQNPGQVYLLNLKDPNDPTLGIDITRIAEVTGDPYMYTDFTGATLYVTNGENTFDLKSSEGYRADSKLVSARFNWQHIDNLDKEEKDSLDWPAITLEARCFSEADSESPPEYEEIAEIAKNDANTDLAVSTCKGKVVDFLQIKLTNKTPENLMLKVSNISVTPLN